MTLEDHMAPLTRSRIDAALSLIHVGAIIRAVHNTYIPSRDGLRVRVTKVGKSFIEGVTLNAAGRISANEPYKVQFPATVSGWVTIDDTGFTFHIPLRGDHTSQWALEAASASSVTA